MRVAISKGIAKGRITAPASKSIAHRLLICAAMSEGISKIYGISDCEDVLATLDCLNALGIKTERNGSDITVHGRNLTEAIASSPLECRESGSTLRFIIPIAMLSGNLTVFRAAKSLMSRPMNVYQTLFAQKKLKYEQTEESITVCGKLRGGEYSVVGNVSSQFISGLIFALPLTEEDSYIRITPPIESRSYINLTLDSVRKFGIVAEWIDEHTIYIPKNQKYKAQNVSVEGDYSGAAFLDALNSFSHEVEIDGLNPNSLQGDIIYKKYFEMLKNGAPSIHIGDCPDLGPILFAVAAAKCGGVFSGTKRLKIKESDRALAMAEELKKFGTSVSVYDDTVVIYPADFHKPTEILNGHNDHRIVLSLSVLLTLTGGEIEGAEVIAKSYPKFFDDLSSIGIEVKRYEA